MKQTTLFLFSFTHSSSLNRWAPLFWIIIGLDAGDTTLPFNMINKTVGEPIKKHVLYRAILWIHVLLQDVMSWFALMQNPLCWIRSQSAEEISSILSKKNPWLQTNHLEHMSLIYSTIKENTCSWGFGWKTPWTLLMVNVCLWLQHGLL